jgi:hypothetical protein
MLITPRPSSLSDLDFLPGPPRREGIHVSACIKRVLIALEPERFGGELDMTRVEIGFTIERLIEEAWRLRRTNVTRPGDFERDGIIGSPDALSVDDDGVCVEEIKCTWMSSRGCPDDRRFVHWIWQMKAYCTLVGTQRARLHAFFVNGDYKTREPQFLSWDLQFHDSELAENWMMLATQAEALRSQAPRP